MKKLLILVCFVMAAFSVHAQDLGLSFSYFIPKNGYFSTPISPFSIRGLGFDINRFLAFETGASLYRMSGLSMKDLPFETKDPLVGPNFTIFVPAELVIQFKGNGIEFDLKGGGFFFYGFDQKLNYGNLDKAIRQDKGWEVANSSFTFKNKPGFGYHAGAELTVSVTEQVGVSIETNYLIGQSALPMTGSYSGGVEGGTIEKVSDVEYADAKIDFTGLEFSIGLIFNSGGGNGMKPKKRRR